MAGQTAGPIETKLDTRIHVHPGSVSVKVNVKVIHYETPGTLRESDTWRTLLKLRPEDGEATPGERLRNFVRTTGNYSSSNEARRRRRRAAPSSERRRRE